MYVDPNQPHYHHHHQQHQQASMGQHTINYSNQGSLNKQHPYYYNGASPASNPQQLYYGMGKPGSIQPSSTMGDLTANSTPIPDNNGSPQSSRRASIHAPTCSSSSSSSPSAMNAIYYGPSATTTTTASSSVKPIKQEPNSSDHSFDWETVL
ncbi:hypothetical protein BC941DRAFT_431703 [Chlamydoabsidia padenii]|nr:hypothetical protein BC941DRAFT_431703 [Chlamydoabsidia padenii]